MATRSKSYVLGLLWLSSGAAIACALIHRFYTRKEVIGHEGDQRRREIEAHMLKTQRPARLLKIRVAAYDSTRLTLVAPLSLNRNVHGTAFAGSLYSVAVLASYYLARDWLLRLDDAMIDPTYVLVARAGSIRYLKPVTSEKFEATSRIPEEASLQSFVQDLKQKRKAIINVDGEILQRGEEVSCRYSIEVCAYFGK